MAELTKNIIAEIYPHAVPMAQKYLEDIVSRRPALLDELPEDDLERHVLTEFLALTILMVQFAEGLVDIEQAEALIYSFVMSMILVYRQGSDDADIEKLMALKERAERLTNEMRQAI